MATSPGVGRIPSPISVQNRGNACLQLFNDVPSSSVQAGAEVLALGSMPAETSFQIALEPCFLLSGLAGTGALCPGMLQFAHFLPRLRGQRCLAMADGLKPRQLHASSAGLFMMQSSQVASAAHAARPGKARQALEQ